MVKGGNKYVPKEVVEELNNVMSMYNLRKESDAFKKMVEDVRIGREIKFALHRGRK